MGGSGPREVFHHRLRLVGLPTPVFGRHLHVLRDE
jgi:hypothetical protein